MTKKTRTHVLTVAALFFVNIFFVLLATAAAHDISYGAHKTDWSTYSPFDHPWIATIVTAFIAFIGFLFALDEEREKKE